MRPQICWLIIAAAVQLFASFPKSARDLSDQSLSEDTAIPWDQALLPLEPVSLDLTELIPDTSISPQDDAFASGLDDFSAGPDLFTLADCSASNIFSLSADDKSRLKRGAQCENPDELASPPMLSIPTIDDMDTTLRDTIMEENPNLYDVLWTSQFKDDDNSACIILTASILPIGACAPGNTAALTYRFSRTFPWSPLEVVTLWDVSYVTYGKMRSINTPSGFFARWRLIFCHSYLAPKLAMGCPSPYNFVCCRAISLLGKVPTGIECVFWTHLQSTWPKTGM